MDYSLRPMMKNIEFLKAINDSHFTTELAMFNVEINLEPRKFQDKCFFRCESDLVNDNLNNRKLAEKYPLPVIFGIEEYLEGPMLSYINDHGYVLLGFEAGQLDAPNSMEKNKTFILQSFLPTGFMKNKALYHELIRSRRKLPYVHSFFEVKRSYRIKEDDEFKTLEAYVNF